MENDQEHFFLEVENAVYLKNYEIFFKLNDGSFGVMDFKDELWGEAFEPLKDVSVFRNFFLNHITHTIEWSTGADLSPNYIKSKLKKVAWQEDSNSQPAYF